MTQALIVRDDARLACSFTEQALALKDAALEKSALIARVNDAATQANAVEAQQDIANLLNQAEKARKAAKEPVLEFGRRIDAAAKSFVSDLKGEEIRIATLVGDFQKLEEARVRAAELARIAEQRKLEEERRAAEQKALREAEILREKLDAEAAELARKRRESESAEDAARVKAAELELQRQRALAEAQSHEELDRIQEQHAQAIADLPVTAPIRVDGQRIRKEWLITVVDIWLLAKSHPTCVKIEPRLSEIKTLLDAGVKVAGVNAMRETRAGVTVNSRPAIDV